MFIKDSFNISIIYECQNTFSLYFSIFKMSFVLLELLMIFPNKKSVFSILQSFLKIPNILVSIGVKLNPFSMRQVIFPISIIWKLSINQSASALNVVLEDLALVVGAIL